MRITAGTHRNRVLKSLTGDVTRPTTDKVKEAVFSKLGTYFESGRILDLFGGSGAISLEAISRGFDSAVIVEKNRSACNIINENVSLLKENDKVTVFNCSYTSAINRLKDSNESFDLIYADPPYRFNIGNELIELIGGSDLMKTDGYLILETLKEEEINESDDLYIEKQALYGITKITYLRRRK